MKNIQIISQELAISAKLVQATLQLLEEGGTVPFIARYRKEVTGGLDEVQITSIRDRALQLQELDKRKEAVIKSISEQGKLTPELENSIMEAINMAQVEDLYLPYKPKRRTRASMAKEKGLEPLADKIFEQNEVDIHSLAEEFLSEELGVNSVEEALAGARDIIAEKIAEDSDVRAKVREVFFEQGIFHSRVVPGKEDQALKYKDYFDWKESVKTAPSHRVLAMRRGEKEELLYLDILVEEENILPPLDYKIVKGSNDSSTQVRMALLDGYKRLIKPSMETEVRVFTRQKADEEAIRVFTGNARQLLLSAPMGQKKVLAIDPGFRTGCKVVCLDAQGNLLENDTIYPHNGAHKLAEAQKLISDLVKKYDIEAIAVGNGTAGRETEDFLRKMSLKNVQIVMVNESGASIYSASDVAREEFPDYDITVRGAISIGRRLMDPLAELVKIDPKSIGVGQYQHDVDQSKLQTALDDTVRSCVNAVGVELNTASKELLSYVSGLGPSLAKQIVQFRKLHGPFKNREELKRVPRLGEKAFEQAAGFLRIHNGENPLDGSAVHPERYSLIQKMAQDLSCKIEDLLKDESLRKNLKLENYIQEDVGLPTLKDIVSELSKPGRDPRDQFESMQFTEGVNSIEDLKTGMRLPGIVTNITNFGAFVDIGVHQDGLVHLSQMSDSFIQDPNEVVKVQQKVMVTVTEVDIQRNRIALSMKSENGNKPRAAKSQNSNKPQKTFKNTNKPKAAEQDMASMLAALKNKFGS